MRRPLAPAADKAAHLAAGRGAKLAYIDDAGQCTYAELADRVNRFGNHLLSLGLRMEDRILIAMHDSIDWPVAFLGAIKRGAIAVPTSTLLTPEEVRPAVEAANAVDGPALVWFEIAEEQNIFPMMPAGKGLSDLIEEWGTAE